MNLYEEALEKGYTLEGYECTEHHFRFASIKNLMLSPAWRLLSPSEPLEEKDEWLADYGEWKRSNYLLRTSPRSARLVRRKCVLE